MSHQKLITSDNFLRLTTTAIYLPVASLTSAGWRYSLTEWLSGFVLIHVGQVQLRVCRDLAHSISVMALLRLPRVGFGAHVCYHCRISPPCFLAECRKRRLNQDSFVLLFFRLFTLFDLYLVFACLFSCTALFVSISQVIGCEDRLRNDLYCVGWGVKLYSLMQSRSYGFAVLELCCSKVLFVMHSVESRERKSGQTKEKQEVWKLRIRLVALLPKKTNKLLFYVFVKKINKGNDDNEWLISYVNLITFFLEIKSP